MNNNQKNKRVYAFAVLLLLLIIGYNIWSYCAGYCTTSSLLAFSFPAKILLVGITIAIFFLLSCKSKKKQINSQMLGICTCGSRLRSNWEYCPDCGQQRTLR